MNIYIRYDSPLELNLIRKYIGEIKDFIAANGDSLISPIGTVLEAVWLPGVNFNAYKYRLTYRIDKFVYPRIPWSGHIAYVTPYSNDNSTDPHEFIKVFKEPDADIIFGLAICRATYDNIKECERYTE